MIKSKLMAAANNELAYINSSNNLVGAMNPLRMFFNAYSVSGSGLEASVIDAIKKVQVKFSTSILETSSDVLDINAAFTGGTGVPPAYMSAEQLANLSLGANDDVLMIIAGTPQPVDADQRLYFLLRESTNNAFLGCRNKVSGTATGGRIVDDAAVAVAGVDTLTSATEQVIATAFDRSANMTAYRDSGTNASIASTDTDITTVTGGLTFSTGVDVSIRGQIKAVGYYIFPNGTLPKNWKAAAAEIGAQWQLGNYVAGHPSWANL